MKRAAPVKIKNILAPGSNLTDRLVPDLGELKRIVENLKHMGYRIVLTQGVWDMIHEGHARYLEKALSFGDILVVGVDSDELTRKRKGPTRPVVPQQERLQMLAHLRHVHILVLREVHHGLGKLIETVRPDVLVTSSSTGDFGKKEIAVYKKICGEIITLEPQATATTTGRVRLLTISGAEEFSQEIMRGIPDVVKNALEKIRNK